MAFNISGFATISGSPASPAPPTVFSVWFSFGDPGDEGAQFAQAKPEGALIDGSSDGALLSFNYEIDLTVATGQITYRLDVQNLTGSDTSFALCGGGLV
jgi:hypothetical protein